MGAHIVADPNRRLTLFRLRQYWCDTWLLALHNIYLSVLYYYKQMPGHFTQSWKNLAGSFPVTICEFCSYSRVGVHVILVAKKLRIPSEPIVQHDLIVKIGFKGKNLAIYMRCAATSSSF